MNFQQNIEDIIRQLKIGDLSPSDASSLLLAQIHDELTVPPAPALLAELETFIATSCSRHCGGDCNDQSMQVSILRRVRRLNSGRHLTPVQDGDIVWI